MISVHNITKIVILVVCLPVLTSCSSPEKDKVKFYQSALEYIEKNDREAAILQLLNALQVDAKYGQAHYQLGLLYLEAKESKKAFNSFLRASDVDPENIDANYRVAQFYLFNGQSTESRNKIDLILQMEPTHRPALTLLANVEIVEGNYEAAFETLDKIGDAVDTSPELQNVKGRIFAAQEQWSAAEEAFVKALSLGKDDLSNYRTLLLLYQKTQERDKAKKLLDDMEERFPENPLVHQFLVNYYRSVGDDASLIEEFNALIELAPTNPRYRLQLAEFYREKGNDGDAEKTLVAARLSMKDNSDVLASLATLYFDQEKFDKTRALLDEIKTLDSSHGGVKLIEARFLFKNNNARDAIVLLRELNKDFPEWGEPYFYLGLAHYSLGEVDLAQGAVNVAIQKYGRSSKYHTLMAQIFQAQGSFEDARKEAIVALRLNPKNIRSAIILSRSLVELKRYEQAIALLTDMNRQIKENPEVLESLARAYLGNKQVEEAEKALVSLLESNPGNIRAIVLLLDVRYTEDPAGAEKFIKQQLDIIPESNQLYVLLAEILSRQSKYDEALENYKKAQELRPEDVQSYLAEARLLSKLGKKEQALQNYTTVLKMQPNTLSAHMGMAEILHENGDVKAAMLHYRKALVVNENYAPAANNLAWLIASDPEGDLGEALMLAMRAKQISPDSPVISDTLGWVHYQRQSYSLAVTQFELALQALPDNMTMAYHLALAQAGNGEREAAVAVLNKLLARNETFPERGDAEKLLDELSK